MVYVIILRKTVIYYVIAKFNHSKNIKQIIIEIVLSESKENVNYLRCFKLEIIVQSS